MRKRFCATSRVCNTPRRAPTLARWVPERWPELFVCHRSRSHRARTRLFAHHGEQPRRRQRSRFRAGLSFRALRNRHASFAARRRLRALRVAGIRLRDASRRIFDRQQPDAAEEKSRCMGIDARQNRPHHRRAGRAADHAEGIADAAISAICRKTRKRCSRRTIKSPRCWPSRPALLPPTRFNETD